MAQQNKTASTHRSTLVQGTHRLDIVGYSGVRKALGARNTVRSGNFHAGGFTWALLCCFDHVETTSENNDDDATNDVDQDQAMASLEDSCSDADQDQAMASLEDSCSDADQDQAMASLEDSCSDADQDQAMASLEQSTNVDQDEARSNVDDDQGKACMSKKPRRRECQLVSISLELYRNYTNEALVAMASIRIDETTGTGNYPAAVWRSQEPQSFPASWCTCVTWELGVPDAFRQHESRYVDLDGDRLTVHCTVDVLKEEEEDAASRNCFVSVPPPPTISKDVHRILKDAQLWPPDVTFDVGGSEIQAHKLVLAMRSPVFAAQFLRGDMKDRSTLRVGIIDGAISAAALKSMLYFVYTDKQPGILRGKRKVAMAQELLVAADLYDLERLRLMCEKTLSESLDAGNVMSALMLVHQRHSCQRLEDRCIEFIASDPDVYAAVRASKEYKELRSGASSCFVSEMTEKIAERAVAMAATSSSSSSSSSSSAKMTRSGTASRSSYNPAATASGEHEFRIGNLSAVRKRHGVGKRVRSGRFHVGGHDWAIDVYPSGSGCTETKEEHIGVFLSLLTAAAAGSVVQASAVFTICDPDGGEGFHQKLCARDDYAANESRGFPRFITVACADSYYLGHDGSLTLHCQIHVTTESSCTARAAIVDDVPPSNMAWQLEQLLETEQGCDVTFLVEGEEEIRAHRIIVAARSPELHDQMAASSGHVVRMDGMAAWAFKAMLHFIYTDELPHGGDCCDMLLAQEMLAAACRFRLERMKRLCENLLAEHVTTVPDALDTVKAARRCGCPELEQYCVAYMSSPHVAKEVTAACLSLFLDGRLSD